MTILLESYKFKSNFQKINSVVKVGGTRENTIFVKNHHI